MLRSLLAFGKVEIEVPGSSYEAKAKTTYNLRRRARGDLGQLSRLSYGLHRVIRDCGGRDFEETKACKFFGFGQSVGNHCALE